MTNGEIINEIKCLLFELNNGEDAVSYLTQNDMKWLNENIKALEQEPKIKVLDRDEVIRKLGEVDVYKASAWVTFFKDLGYLKLKICEVEEAIEQEPTIKNDLALIHTEGLDEEIRCSMCTNSMKSDSGCDGSCVVNEDMYKAVMDAIEKRIDMPPTTTLTEVDIKEGIDAISRHAVDRSAWQNLRKLTDENVAFYEHLLDLPSVTPIRPKGHWIETAEEYYKAINEKGGGVNENTPYFTNDITCSECLAKFSVIDNEAERFDFCPCCGSDNK